jgi:type I restriction-modification system DNA methylase subunit
LNNNIKCGNSLIDDPEVAGDKAFSWEKEFPSVFPPLEGDQGGGQSQKRGFDVVIGNPPYVQLQSMGETSTEIEKMNFKSFEKTGDLYCLFYELGNIILKDNGLLGYITSNKWLRANYGKSLRNYLLENTQPLELIDLGSGIFESATVDSNILIFKKTFDNRKEFSGLDISKEFKIETGLDYRMNSFIKGNRRDSYWMSINFFIEI